jgi:hypothetical protein
MNQTQAAVIFLAGTAITGIVATTIQTSRLEETKRKLRTADYANSLFKRAYQMAAVRMPDAAFAQHTEDIETMIKFDNITQDI